LISSNFLHMTIRRITCIFYLILYFTITEEHYILQNFITQNLRFLFFCNLLLSNLRTKWCYMYSG
jgi:hypothetical protein